MLQDLNDELFGCSVLIAHLKWGFNGFRARDVGLEIARLNGEFTSFAGQPKVKIYNMQIARELETLVQHGHLQRRQRQGRAHFAFTRAGFNSMLYRLREPADSLSFDHFRLLQYFLQSYKVDLLSQNQFPDGHLTSQQKMLIEKMVDLNDLRESTLQRIEGEISGLKGLIDEAQGAIDYITGSESGHKPWAQIVEESESLFPSTHLSAKARMRFLGRLGHQEQRSELIDRRKSLIANLWLPKIQLLLCYLDWLEETKST